MPDEARKEETPGAIFAEDVAHVLRTPPPPPPRPPKNMYVDPEVPCFRVPVFGFGVWGLGFRV